MTRSAAPVAFAWFAHFVTALGTVIAFLAVTAAIEGDHRLALLWLLIGLAVDGLDGSLARAAQVKELAPRINGDALDLIIDYLNYVFVPTLIIVRAGLVPAPLALPLAALILVSALYNFTRADMKTPDNYFRGFPALWNVVAFYFVIVTPDADVAAAIVCALALLTFTSLPFLHPFRVRDYGRLSPAAATLWGLSTVALLWPDWPDGVGAALLALSLATAALILLLGLIRAVRGPRLDDRERAAV